MPFSGRLFKYDVAQVKSYFSELNQSLDTFVLETAYHWLELYHWQWVFLEGILPLLAIFWLLMVYFSNFLYWKKAKRENLILRTSIKSMAVAWDQIPTFRTANRRKIHYAKPYPHRFWIEVRSKSLDTMFDISRSTH